MGRLSREAGGLGDYSDDASNETGNETTPEPPEPEPEPQDEAPEPDEDEPA